MCCFGSNVILLEQLFDSFCCAPQLSRQNTAARIDEFCRISSSPLWIFSRCRTSRLFARRFSITAPRPQQSAVCCESLINHIQTEFLLRARRLFTWRLMGSVMASPTSTIGTVWSLGLSRRCTQRRAFTNRFEPNNQCYIPGCYNAYCLEVPRNDPICTSARTPAAQRLVYE